MGIKRCKIGNSNYSCWFFILEVVARNASDGLGFQANTAAHFYNKLRELIAL
jgi:hypothetical protein